MKLSQLSLINLVLYGVAGHGHGHHGEEIEGGKEIPLHEREWVRDSAEELERKWGFEVCD